VAKTVMKMPEEFLLKISKLSDKTDEIIPKVLEAGGKVVEEKVEEVKEDVKKEVKAVVEKEIKEVAEEVKNTVVEEPAEPKTEETKSEE